MTWCHMDHDNDNDNGRTDETLYTHKRYPIARPHGRAMGYLLWVLWQKMAIFSRKFSLYFFVFSSPVRSKYWESILNIVDSGNNWICFLIRITVFLCALSKGDIFTASWSKQQAMWCFFVRNEEGKWLRLYENLLYFFVFLPRWYSGGQLVIMKSCWALALLPYNTLSNSAAANGVNLRPPGYSYPSNTE